MFLKSSTGQNDGYDTQIDTQAQLKTPVKLTVITQTHGVTNEYISLYTLLSLQVRVFTYLIGREMTFAENVKWIACNNKGKTKWG